MPQLDSVRSEDLPISRAIATLEEEIRNRWGRWVDTVVQTNLGPGSFFVTLSA